VFASCRCISYGDERVFVTTPTGGSVSQLTITDRQHQILEMIERHLRERGYPPSVREIGEAVGLASPSTVHSHLATLERLGYLRRDPTKPRAIEVRWDPNSGAAVEKRPVVHVPLVGDVAAGTDVLAQENVEELLPLPADLTGEGELFMLRVRGDSMVDAGILDGDLVVVRAQQTAQQGDIVVAGIPGDEATVKTYTRKGDVVTLLPANQRLEPMVFSAAEVSVFGRVVTVMRKL
jgi:repressor LexA